jgi:hypothetical protein
MGQFMLDGEGKERFSRQLRINLWMPVEFLTKNSAGATPSERINNLALPPNNNALVESNVILTRDQILLEGRVAPQTEWANQAADGIGIPRTGGGWQVVTNGEDGLVL